MTGPMPMFPLGNVLFPTMVLPLHVFEPRYRALARAVTDGDGRFGVVLIERGSEVGGDDVRTDVGTVAEVVESEEMEDGRWILVAVGRERLRVDEWIDDDPYPQAFVRPLGDTADPGRSTDADRWPEVVARLRRALALQAELGEARAPVDVDLSDEHAIGTFQAAAIGPFGPVDQQAILAMTDPSGRLTLVGDLLRDATELIEARLAGA